MKYHSYNVCFYNLPDGRSYLPAMRHFYFRLFLYFTYRTKGAIKMVTRSAIPIPENKMTIQ